MMYYWNKDAFREFKKEMKLTNTNVLNAVGTQAFSTAKNWTDGQPINIERLLDICNKFQYPLERFFICDGDKFEIKKQGNHVDMDNEIRIMLLEKDMECEKKIQQERKLLERSFTLEREKLQSIIDKLAGKVGEKVEKVEKL